MQAVSQVLRRDRSYLTELFGLNGVLVQWVINETVKGLEKISRNHGFDLLGKREGGGLRLGKVLGIFFAPGGAGRMTLAANIGWLLSLLVRE